ncbi:protein jagged-1 [Drosophila guanche]|uniref:Blast:Delta-like protein 1 n=1 Tax=Drosophila guanche TaxID=7266 RepID=A0A3B0K5Y3_DROGU|nr:protein jagged-1 [Drosophila guanche]SPP89614.1 blast:Delta-like protein 1 [Drosophila guanche]
MLPCNLGGQATLLLTTIIATLSIEDGWAFLRNFEVRQSSGSKIPLWKQRACEKPQNLKANAHYLCDEEGDFTCLPGWQGDLCQVPMCRRGCDPMNGYCHRPGECRCRIGYSGEMCETCIPLPGCQHGDCTKPFECICKPGWAGLFCTEPTCRSGCHSTRGYCEAPGECRCRIGYAGRTCSECATMPGCQQGTCTKPLECLCLPGYTGLLCQTPLCASDCSTQHGYCRKPGECRCKVGWTGSQCDKCFPYPGCANGDCEAPWECNCHSGWGGMLCDEKLSYCTDNPGTCENEGKCLSVSREGGSFRCLCRQGYLGKNCEIRDDFLLTSLAPQLITPPPLELGLELDDVRSVDTDVNEGVPDASGNTVGQVEKLPAAVPAPTTLTPGTAPPSIATTRTTATTSTMATFPAAGAGSVPGSHNTTYKALSVAASLPDGATSMGHAATTPKATAAKAMAGAKGNATSWAVPSLVPGPTESSTDFAGHVQKKETSAPAVPTTPKGVTTTFTSRKDGPAAVEDDDDDDDEEDAEYEEDDEENEDEKDEEEVDGSDQFLPNKF